ncbi:MAG: hypothetical protein AVDCRST_MAG79-2798 [uncultured Thermoleophilia bacterium]|uniref:Uncharacterized protein n=1 Tax=uncultured Thermoleophilia bacterium TaxID=1497501 RepID=A0A6J4UMK3_9ACTN|nr:MAG: hypothetical protein AVDCRST_MAG79-2798 [uncultured Thermoleophilia bacterium]
MTTRAGATSPRGPRWWERPGDASPVSEPPAAGRDDKVGP